MQNAFRTEPDPHSFSAARRAYGGALLYLGAVLTSGSAVIHLAVAPEHFQEYAPFGILFVLTGAAQLALAGAVLVAPSRRLFVLGATATAGLLAVWLISRTVGVPIGPRPWVPESIGIPDVACVAMEIGSAASFPLLLGRRSGARPRRLLRLTLATVPASLLAAALTFVGVSATVGGMPVAFNAGPMVPGRTSTTVDLLTEPAGGEPVRSYTLTAQVSRVGGAVAWTYNGSVPGPELRAVQGERLRVTLVNRLPAATTLHWHGVRVPNAEDGVAGITQQAVPPGHSFTYEFVLRDAGTYWYHSHQDTQAQLGAGLYGALVVEPAAGHVAEARDYTVLLHNAPGIGAVSVNGVSGDLHLAARPGETVRLRLVNAVVPGMDGGPEAPVLLGAPYRVVALDGHDLNGPQPLGPERLALGMGQRADLVFTVPASGTVRLVDTEVQGATSAIQGFFPKTPRPQLSVTVGSGPSPSTAGAGALPFFDPTGYGAPGGDPVADARPAATYPLLLAEHPGFHDGTIQLVHTINGDPSPSVPPITVREGEVVRLHVVNDTAEYHPMHLHGHVFSVLARNGRPIQGTPLHLDSALVGPNESWDLAFLADNPGIWMLHCHVLLHASTGMMMTVNYAGVWTPYTMGSASGNVPE